MTTAIRVTTIIHTIKVICTTTIKHTITRIRTTTVIRMTIIASSDAVV